MIRVHRKDRLKKELTLPYVFAIAAGTTLSAGFFLLPGIAAREAGPAIVLSYLLAALPVLPAVFSISELGTAMPRAGGAYYFVDRSLGPVAGTIGGFGTWLALILKTAFALIGMGAYLHLLFPRLDIVSVAVALTLLFGLINLLGAKESGTFQIALVGVLIVILVGFITAGLPRVAASNLAGMFDETPHSILSTAGLVYISYVGVTKVASVVEEIKDPERNLPRGIILAMLVAVVIYVGGTLVMVGVIPLEELRGDLTPVATAGTKILGTVGLWLMSLAAMLAFTSVANAGILSASRYPMAMSRDGLLPTLFRRYSRFKTPKYSIAATVAVTVVFLLAFDPLKIAKLASAFQLMMLILICAALIVMRESRIPSYDPGYKSPLYPWVQIGGIAISLLLVGELGARVVAVVAALVCACLLWYRLYARARVARTGAIFHIFARLGGLRYDALDSELREILKEKGLREHDPFSDVVAGARIVEVQEGEGFADIVRRAAEYFASITAADAETLSRGFMQGTRVGATPVSHGVALPHMRTPHVDSPQLFIARSREGVSVELDETLGAGNEESAIHAFFFLLSPEDDAGLHLRILAHIAERVDDDDFMDEWLRDRNEQELKETLLMRDRFTAVTVERSSPTSAFIGQKVASLPVPERTAVALIQRNGEFMVPDEDTVLKEGDRLTVVGSKRGIDQLKKWIAGR